MVMLWYLDGDSSMELYGNKLEELFPNSYIYALKYECISDLNEIADLFWNRQLGLSENVWDILMYWFGEFIKEAKQLEPCEYYQGNYYIKCIEDIKSYEI